MYRSSIQCLFCDNQLWYHSPGNPQYNCHGHGDMNISYHYQKHEDPSNLLQLTFIFGHRGEPWTYHHICLAFQEQRTKVYFFGENHAAKPMKEDCLIYSLDHIVQGITAQNAEQYLNRFLKLATFS